MASERPIAGHPTLAAGGHGRATLLSAAGLASLGTVLCVYRSCYGGELGGWAQAISAESW